MRPDQPTLRKAILVFAEQLGHDLAKRRLPRSLRALLELPALRVAPDLSADVHLFTSGPLRAINQPNVHLQQGTTFAEKLENAVEQIAGLGYEQLAIVGRDCPKLEEQDLVLAFRQLSNHQLVLGPDHRGGCYLIALRVRDRHLLRGIRWNRDRDFAQLRSRSRAVATLAVKPDLDSWADLRLIAANEDWIAQLLRFALPTIFGSLGIGPSFVSLSAQHMRLCWQLPPPAPV